MTGWKEEKLENIFYIVKEVYKPSNEHQYKYVGLEHIEQGTLRLNGWGYSNSVQSNKYFFKKDDILFGKLRPYFRKVIKAPFDGVCSTDIWVCRAKKDFDQNFLFYFLANQEFIDTANSTDEGTRMPRADWNYLKKTTWIIPPLPEQKAIAEVLSSLDDKIDLLTKQNKTLEDLAQAYFRKWFIEDASDKWEEIPLGQLFVISSGKGLKKEKFTEHGQYRVLGANGEIGKTNEYLFNERLIYTGRVGTLGNVFIVDREPVWLSDNTLVFRNIKYFFFVYFSLKWANLADYNVGSTQPLIRQSDIKEIRVFMPDKERLDSFENLANSIFAKINSNQKQIQLLQKLRDTLLPKLISGEIRVKM